MNADSLVIMVGPSLDASGGVTAVVKTLLAEGALRDCGVTYIPTWTPDDAFRGLGMFFRAVWAVTTGAHRGHIVHVHMASRGSFYRKAIILAIARLRGAHTVLHLHGAEFHLFARNADCLTRAWIRSVFRGADRVVVLSDEWRARVAEFTGRSDAIVIPNPVCIPSEQARFDGAPTVVFLGRLGQRKGVPELLEAVRILQEAGRTDVRWVLAGDGDVVAARRTAAALPVPDAVEIPGWVDQKRVQHLLRTAWVFCLPSHNEGLPVSLLQAMAAGVACVVTPVGGIPEYIRDGMTGILVPPGDPLELANGIGRALGSAELCRNLGARARAEVAKRCAPLEVVGALTAMYSDLRDGREDNERSR